MWRRLTAALGPQTAHNFAVDAFAAGFFAIFQGLTSPFIAVIAVRRGAVPWQIGWITAVPATALLLATWYGRLAEGRSRVPLVVFATGIARLFLLAAGWAHGVWVYLLSYTAFNAVNAAGSPAYTAIERNIYHEKWRGQLMGGVKFVLGLCQFLTMLVAGPLLDRYHAGPVFTVAVLFGLASAGTFALMREPASPPRPKTGGATSPRALLAADPRFARMVLAVTLVGGANFLVAPAYPIYWVHRLHLTNAHVAWINAAYSLAWMACYPLWGRLCDRRRPAAAVLAGLASYVGPPLLYAIGANLPLALLGGWMQGMGDSALDVGWQNHVMRLGGPRVGTYAGAYYTFMGVRGTIGPLLGSLIVLRFGLEPVFLVALALIACGLWVARRLPDGPLDAAVGSGGRAVGA